MHNKKNPIFSKILIFILFLILIVFLCFPFYWMIITSLKSSVDYQNTTGFQSLFPQDGIRWENFVAIFTETSISNSFWISFQTTFLTVLFKITFSLIAGFGLSYYNFKFRSFAIFIILVFIMIPEEALLIGQRNIIIETNLLGTIPSLFLPLIVSSFLVFYFQRAFNQIPQSLYLLAKIDNIKTVSFFFRIAIPYIRPSIVFAILINVVSTWNEFLWPSLVSLNYDYLQTTPVFLYNFSIDPIILRESPQLIMAASTISLIPLFILFFASKKFMINRVYKRSSKKWARKKILKF